MKDKRLLYVILLAGLVIIVVAFFVYIKNPVSDFKYFSSGTEKSELANPASVNCEEKGGELEMRENKAGTAGFCVFEDGSECEEWAFFKGQCKKGEIFCKNLCGNENCEETVCMATGCPCAETAESCEEDCVP